VLATYIAGRSINGDIGQTAQEGRVRPPIRDPLQRRRKDVLLRAEEDVIRAADALARRVGVSRNEALNAMLRAFVQDETDPALRLATLVQAMIAAGAAATVEAIRHEVRR
jgi:hypothetical protein